MEQSLLKGEYIPHYNLEDMQVQYSIVQLRDEKKTLRLFLDDYSKSRHEQDLEIYIHSQIVVNNNPIQPPQKHILEKKLLLNKEVNFNYYYRDLSYNSMIAITIWCTEKNYDKQKPLGSTTIPLFDEDFKLRQGKFYLYIWPDQLPDISFDSKTLGLVMDKNVQTLKNTIQNQSYFQDSYSNQVQNQIKNQLNLRLHYTSQKVPAAFLEIEFPRFDNLVFYEDIKYDQEDILQNVTIHKNKAQVQSSKFADCIISADFEMETQQCDPMQEIANRINMDDENAQKLKPNQAEDKMLKQLIKKPALGDLNSTDKKLIYKYRYYLRNDKEALVQFLHSISWNSQRERNECIKLLKQWTPCDYADALHLLSSFFCANNVYNKKHKKPLHEMKIIREYAVEQLKKTSNENIQTIIMQLVQGFRYECIQDGVSKSSLVKFLIEIGSNNKNIGIQLLWCLNVEKDEGEGKGKISDNEFSVVLKWYKDIYEEYMEYVQNYSPEIARILQDQLDFRFQIKDMFEQIAKKEKDREKRIKLIKERLKKQDNSTFKYHLFCLFPELEIQDVFPDSTTIFKSAMAPLKMGWRGKDLETNKETKIDFIYKKGDDLRQDQLILQTFYLMESMLKTVDLDFRLTPFKVLACSKNDGFMEFVPGTSTVQSITKSQSIIQYFQKLSSDPNNDVYKNLDGYKDPSRQKEFEMKIKEENNKIKDLQDIKSIKGVNHTIMENYILSCAGYCVITYFLGIGDRHLENLMIDQTGKMLHIDFGFILGKDPKVGAPPFKLSPDMVNGLGGKDHKNYITFTTKCVQVYKYLRNYCKFIVNLFYLMVDSGMPDITLEAIQKMVEKFCLDEEDDQAERHFLNILEESVSAFLAKLNDRIHQIAVDYFRN